MSIAETKRFALRKHFRDARRALTPAQQLAAADALPAHCLSLPAFQQAKHVALYLSSDGEIDPKGIIEYCWRNDKQVYLPVLHPFTSGHLLFLRYHAQSQLVPNKYGIAEPILRCPDVCPVQDLDIIFTPLVAFDALGNRLGMGGGFYDRTLARVDRYPKQPSVIGLAHDVQRTDTLPSASWDIPIQTIITPQKVFSPS